MTFPRAGLGENGFCDGDPGQGPGAVVAGGEVVLDRGDEVGRGWQITKSSCRMSWRAVPGLLAFFTFACAVKPANVNKPSKTGLEPAKQC